MLQIRMLSGEAVTSIAVEEICDVRGLKQRLNQLHGLPPRFRQRVLAHAQDVEDSVTLDSPMDLDLVLLSFAEVSESQVDDMVDAARRGCTVEVPSSHCMTTWHFMGFLGTCGSNAEASWAQYRPVLMLDQHNLSCISMSNMI